MDKSKHLQQQLQAFADERDWEQFHSPKNLSLEQYPNVTDESPALMRGVV
jgi:hypothetical protein